MNNNDAILVTDLWPFINFHLFPSLTCLVQFVDRQYPSTQWQNNIIQRSNSVSLLFQAQLQDAKRRWEELQNFLHNVNAEREKLQASNQGHFKEHACSSKPSWLNDWPTTVFVSSDLHSQLVTAESEMNNKMKEIQMLHNSLTEAMVSKERLEQRVVEFMEVSQHSVPDESLQARVQVSWTTRLRKRPCEKWLWTEQCTFCSQSQCTLFNRNLWMKIKIFRSRTRTCRPRSLHRYPVLPRLSISSY